jgi:hypothetical protein
VSNTAVTFVGTNPNATVTPTFGAAITAPGSGVVTTAVSPLNISWGAPMGSSIWIQTEADAGGSTILPGTYRFSTSFTIPPLATHLLLNLSTLSDNAVEVYLNGNDIGGQAIADCTDASSLTCNWKVALNVTDAASLHTGSNTLTIDLVNTRVGYNGKGPGDPSATADCAVPSGFRAPDWTAQNCKNPSGLDFVGTVYYAPAPPPPSTTWCSPGFWKTHPDLWTAYHDVLYSSLSGAAPFGKKAPAGDASILTVVSNPSVYGGPATNSVADFLSNKAFGTPIGSGVESCPDPSDPRFPLTLPPG